MNSDRIKTNRIFQYSVSDLDYDTNNPYLGPKDDILWTPHEGEWCWFWENSSIHRPDCRQFGYMKSYTNSSIEVYCTSEQRPYSNCEPFLNSLPSHLK